MSFDDDCSAGRPYRCGWRARSRRSHMTPLVNEEWTPRRLPMRRRVDAKASSDEAVIDVEVDRCIDENSASNHKHVAFLNASFTEASSRLHRDSSQISLPRTINVPVLQSHREAPCTD